jgi:hypothetical protein
VFCDCVWQLQRRLARRKIKTTFFPNREYLCGSMNYFEGFKITKVFAFRHRGMAKERKKSFQMNCFIYLSCHTEWFQFLHK